MIEQHGLKEGLAKWALRSASAAAATSGAKSTDQAKVRAATKKQQRIDSMKKAVVKMKAEPTTIVIDESGAGDGEKSKPEPRHWQAVTRGCGCVRAVRACVRACVRERAS
jgi:hypothetical protein